MKAHKANKVTEKQINDAFNYFMDTGALLKRIANDRGITLIFAEEGE